MSVSPAGYGARKVVDLGYRVDLVQAAHWIRSEPHRSTGEPVRSSTSRPPVERDG
jgi:hypothetical protein